MRPTPPAKPSRTITLTLCALALAAVSTALIAQAAPRTYLLTVAGLSCPFCAYGVERELSAVPGVVRVQINLAEGIVEVIAEDNVPLSEFRLRQAVEDAGFTLERVEEKSPGKTPTAK